MAARSPQIPATIVCNSGKFPAVYKRLDTIGSGGFGKVFKVLDTKTHVQYAMKVIPNDRVTSGVEKLLLNSVFSSMPDKEVIKQEALFSFKSL